MSEQSNLLEAMYRAVLDGDRPAAEALAQKVVDAGIAPLEAIEQGFARGIRQAGLLWEEGEYFLPELVTSAEAMKGAMAVLQPALAGGSARKSLGRVVIGTVQGDIHDIGKTLVATLLSANGFEVTDEGADVPIEQFVTRAREVDADLICASALLTTTMVNQKALVTAVQEAQLRTRIMVGGAPVTQKWAEDIGADGYADNAVAAVDAARRLVSANA